MSTDTLEAPAFPLARTCPFDPPPQYEEFRAAGGPGRVRLWDGTPAWIFTSFEDVRTVMADNRFSGAPATPGFPMLSPSRAAVLNEPPTFLRMDPPAHGPLRRMFTREFMVKRIEAMRPRIEQLTAELYDQIEAAGPPYDFSEGFALPLTSTIISEFLGVPAEDREFFQEQSALKMLMNAGPDIPRDASRRLNAYFDQLLRKKEADPHAEDDMLSRLVIDQVLPGHLTHDDAVIHADILIMAGHETTANQIALGLLSFLQNPDQKQKLLADPSLIKSAVDEMLRFHSIVQYNAPRVAIDDVDVNGHLIRKGEAVFALVAAANRDPKAFACPNDFDITRNPDNHLAFSYGVHQCLGQPLARTELQTVFGTIFQRFPNLHLAVPFEEVVFKYESFVHGVEALPLAW